MATRYQINTPVKRYAGTVAGVAFVDGVGQTEDTGALAYFRRHGYGVTELPEAAEVEPAPADDAPKRPAPSATKAAWKAYAISQGMPEAEAEAATRDQLAELYADKTGAEQ